MAQEEEFLLKWNDHHASFFSIVEDLCRTEQLCDVTLACGGKVFETHKLILSVCSPYFRTMLNHKVDKHPIVYLKDVNPQHLEQLLSYMYRGEINVLQNDLGPLIETARGLQIKGLADAGGGGGGEKRLENGIVSGPPPQKSLLKRPRTTTPTPAPLLVKLPKVDAPPSKPKKSSEKAADVAYEVPTSKPAERESNVVKLEEDDGGWNEESIPSEHYEDEMGKDYEDDSSKSYEQELQMEDEQYIQPEGLSGHQVCEVPLPSSLPPTLSITSLRHSPPSPAVSPPPSSLSIQSWCALPQEKTQIFACTYCTSTFAQSKDLHVHVKTAHNSNPQPESSLTSLQRLSCHGVSFSRSSGGANFSLSSSSGGATFNSSQSSGGANFSLSSSSGGATFNSSSPYGGAASRLIGPSVGAASSRLHAPARPPSSSGGAQAVSGGMSGGSPRYSGSPDPGSTQQVFPRPLNRQNVNYSPLYTENKVGMLSKSFRPLRTGQGGLDPIQDTLKQLSRLAGSNQPNQTSIVESADSNQPIVHLDAMPLARSADQGNHAFRAEDCSSAHNSTRAIKMEEDDQQS